MQRLGSPPLSASACDGILRLLDGFGTHFAEWFGRDLQVRLDGHAGVTTVLASAPAATPTTTRLPEEVEEVEEQPAGDGGAS